MFTVRRWDPDDGPRLDDSLGKLRHLPFTRGYRLPPEGTRAWVRGIFDKAAGDPPGSCALVIDSTDEDLLGGVVVQRLPWESGVFEIEMARIPYLFVVSPGGEGETRPIAAALLDAARQVLRGWEIRHCSALSLAEETGIIHALGDDSWRLVDSTLDFTWECGRSTSEGSDPRITARAFIESDREPLHRLARESFTRAIRTRFSADPWLPIEKTGELYAEWFLLACDGEFGDVVVVAEVDGRPVGFNTFKLDPALTEATGVGFANHGIAAVESGQRGMGMQPAMLHWLAEWQRERGGRFNRGRVLIGNYPMQRACLKSGAFVTQAYHTFHTWLEAS